MTDWNAAPPPAQVWGSQWTQPQQPAPTNSTPSILPDGIYSASFALAKAFKPIDGGPNYLSLNKDGLSIKVSFKITVGTAEFWEDYTLPGQAQGNENAMKRGAQILEGLAAWKGCPPGNLEALEGTTARVELSSYELPSGKVKQTVKRILPGDEAAQSAPPRPSTPSTAPSVGSLNPQSDRLAIICQIRALLDQLERMENIK